MVPASILLAREGGWGRAEGEPPESYSTVGSLRSTTATQNILKLDLKRIGMMERLQASSKGITIAWIAAVGIELARVRGLLHFMR
jgi:hypothetical protein